MRVPAAAWLVSAALAGSGGCAPAAPYHGPVPAPGAVIAFAPSSASADPRSDPGADAGAAPRLGPGRRADRLLGTLFVPQRSESIVVLLYGDNRPGYLMQSRRRELKALRGLRSSDFGWWWSGVATIPVLCIEALVPTLDGPRDLVTKVFTHRPRWGREGPVREALARRLPADLVVNVGDIVTYGDRGRLWEDFVAGHRDLRARVPYLACPGNHERTDTELGRANWEAAMGPPPVHGQYWYALDLPDGLARFVFLDSSLLSDPHGRYPDSLQEAGSQEQLAWADSALAAPVRYRFVVMHHPLVSAGHYTRMWSSGPAAARLAARRRRLFDICRRRHVTAVIAGHEHLYQRVFVRSSPRAGFWQITTGGGGAPLHWLPSSLRRRALGQPLPDGLQVDLASAYGFSEFHFCRLVIPRAPGAASLRLDVYQVGRAGDTKHVDRVDLAASPEGP